MKKVGLILGLIWWAGIALAGVNNDQEAFSYCRSNPNAYIAIVWPIAQGKQDEIEAIFKEYGRIIYKKRIRLTSDTAYIILQKAHKNIADMATHMSWYFPPNVINKKARVFVFECSNQANVVACKLKIRNLFNLQYRSIHINDTHRETMELAHLLLKNGMRVYKRFIVCMNRSLLANPEELLKAD